MDGARLAAFRSPPPPLRIPLISGYHIQRWQVAAALSAAVTTTKLIGDHPHVAWARKSAGTHKPIPSRSSGERGLGGEGLLSEKPPLPPEFLIPSQLQ